MPPKKKSKTVPRSVNHPSQSSIDVPRATKDAVKERQDYRCWLCDEKSHRTRRPLEISHVYPQATSKRFGFESSHRKGQIEINNIHNSDNLIALCRLCHSAFDNEEWTFIPENTEQWVKEIEENSNVVQTYASQRNVVYKRILLVPDIYSDAFADSHYRTAFSNKPSKAWEGDPGTTISKRQISTQLVSEGDMPIVRSFTTLKQLWWAYQGSCSVEECPICQQTAETRSRDDEKDDEDDEDDDEDDEDDEDSDEAVSGDSDENDENDRNADDDDNGEGPSSIGRKRPLRTANVNKKIRAKRAGKDWDKSEPYDDSVPWHYRHGYTFYGMSSNDVMNRWPQPNRLEQE